MATESNGQDIPLEELGEPSGREFALLPPDTSKAALLVLCASFGADFLLWGLPFSFGVFQEHYSQLPEFASEASNTQIIGTVCLGVQYIISPVNLLFFRQFPKQRRGATWVGLVLVCLSLLAASFASKVWQLALTQGALFAIGASVISYSGLAYIDEWFVRRKGIAFGISWGGTALSGIAIPYVLSWSLNAFGYRTTLRWLAIAHLVWIAPLLPFLKRRVPPPRVTYFSMPNLRYVFKQPYIGYLLAIVFQSLGYFIPALYLPSYARSQHMSSVAGTATLVLSNTGMCLGCLIVGYLIDRWSTAGPILLTSAGSVVAFAVLWGLSKTVPVLCLFAFVYGLFAGGYLATVPGVIRETMQKHPSIESGLAYSLLWASRGVGNLVSGLLSGALLKAPPLTNALNYGYGSNYGALIAFASVSALLGATGTLPKLFTVLRN